ncbi:hypothetical protein NDU88_001733 [Pleurodeles waltl]|uniref:Uncharacterized protein n=1 Tax=Pleurodeles waltl TaxID=8319 RepID=A0AAV7Q4P8_PLEWA|nr:hypothetical protein NDU88_001733 [Pleurodeles waltl]
MDPEVPALLAASSCHPVGSYLIFTAIAGAAGRFFKSLPRRPVSSKPSTYVPCVCISACAMFWHESLCHAYAIQGQRMCQVRAGGHTYRERDTDKYNVYAAQGAGMCHLYAICYVSWVFSRTYSKCAQSRGWTYVKCVYMPRAM